MKTLSPAERHALKARAHSLNPVVSIAGKGLTPTVLAEIDNCLKVHELIKVRVYGTERDDREALMREVCAQLDATQVQHIGNILILHRENPEKEAVPAVPARKPLAARGAKAAKKPLSKIKAAKTGQRRKIEYGQLRNTRSKSTQRRSTGIR